MKRFFAFLNHVCVCERLPLTTSPGREARASPANAHLHLGRSEPQDPAARGAEPLGNGVRRGAWSILGVAGRRIRALRRTRGRGRGRGARGAAGSGRGIRGRRGKRLALGSPAALVLSLGLVSFPALPDRRSELDRSQGREAQVSPWQPPARWPRDVTLLAPFGAASAGGSRGVLKGGAPRRLGAGGSAPIPRTALFFCSGLGGRTGAGPRPARLLPALRPRNRCVSPIRARWASLQVRSEATGWSGAPPAGF